MVLTKQDFLIKAGLLLAAVAVSSLHWSITMNPDGEALFHLGSVLAFVILVPIIAVIPGALFFGVAALTMDQRTRDHTRACLLMGLYVVALLMVCFNVTKIADLPRPPSAKGGSFFYWYIAYVVAFIKSLPGVSLSQTQQQIDQDKAPPGTNHWLQADLFSFRIFRWLVMGASSLLVFIFLILMFGILKDPSFTLLNKVIFLAPAFAVMLVFGIRWLWKIQDIVRGKIRRRKTIDWSAMTIALIDSKNWNGLLLLTDDWLAAERRNHECWASKGLAHEMLGDVHKAISAYQVSLKCRYDETVAKRLDALVEGRMRQNRAREERERKTKAEDERARGQRTRDSSSRSGNTGSGHIPNPIHLDQYYRILGVQPSATSDEVKAAYKRQMQQYHPDKVASLGKELRDLAEAKSKEINGAYRAIMDALNA
jgi:DnaJ-domain-containing protein 1